MADAEGRKPRYQFVADDLRARVLRGEFPDRARFPTESILCEDYGVSRFTVREALRALQHEGLIQRKQGSGTVIQPAFARGGALHQPISNLGELLQYARDSVYQFTPTGLARLPRQLASQLPGGMPERWHHFVGLRSRGGQSSPIALTDAFVHPSLAQVAQRIEPNGVPIFRQIEQLADTRVARVTQDIQAVSASRRIADQLGIAARSPNLRIIRCYFDADDQVLEISASYHPGDRFAYSMHIDVER